MKRPEGFDRAPGTKERPPTPVAPSTSEPSKPIATKSTKPQSTKPQSPTPQSPKPTPPPTGASRNLRRAESARRRYERAEAKRFTRRSRRRRRAWLVVLAIVVLLAGLVTAAVYSPLLALSTVTVEGTSRVKASDVKSAVADQIGKPLALVDLGALKKELSAFPLIRSYATEIVPPDTLVIRVTERSPIAVVATATGYNVVDPAGVVIEKATDRPSGYPVIDLGTTTSTTSPAFVASVSVLLSLPSDVLAKVDTISAQTADDVTFTLTGVGQVVVWGSAEKSALKARVLTDLIANQDPNAIVKYDVSAPTNPVIGSAG